MRLLVTDARRWSQLQLARIAELGHEIVLMQLESDGLPCAPEQIEGAICNGLFLYHGIDQFTNLRYIQTTSAGLDRIPLDYCERHGIAVKNARGVYSIPIAEFAVSGILDIYKKKRLFFKNQEKHEWSKVHGLSELYGKNVLIVGCGSIGNECAKRLRSFGCLIRGVDTLPIENEIFEEIKNVDSIEIYLKESDIVIISIPLTEKTMSLFNKEMLSHMKKGSVLVNIARGKIVESRALVEALKTTLLGAVLDVFEEEPLPISDELWSLENVIITPHSSFISDQNNKRLFELIMDNLRGAV